MILSLWTVANHFMGADGRLQTKLKRVEDRHEPRGLPQAFGPDRPTVRSAPRPAPDP